jgi:hypothetical protein
VNAVATSHAPLARRLRDELRDLVEVVLLPGLAAVLPWPIAFRIYRRLAATRWLYRDASERALGEAARLGWVADPAEWLRKRKLTTLVDHADHYLSRTRGDGWLSRHVDTEGEWPAGQAGLGLTFHWGAGMWGLRHAAAHGMKAHMLVASVDKAHFAGRSILHRYIVARTRSIALALRRPYIDVSADMRLVLKALRGDEQVFAVIDVPADQVSTSQAVQVMGLPARLPTALLRLAVDKQVPVFVYVTGFRIEDGQRFVRIRQLGVPADLDTLVREVEAELDRTIQQDAPAWHFWSEAERFFRG